MSNQKTLIRFFSIADFKEEEAWLQNQHKNGWKLSNMIGPCFYFFERCTPEDVVYRLDYKNNEETGNYLLLFEDYGWEYIGRSLGWLYFRKPLSGLDSEQDGEIFSDNESKIDMINHVIKTRLLPITIIFFCCLLPNFFRSLEAYDSIRYVLTPFFSFLILLYLYLIIHCSLKLRKLKKEV